MQIDRIERIAKSIQDNEGKVETKKLIERLKSFSFWELITESSKIEIPIIQRDYAQGRTDDKTKKIREKFLEDIIGKISKNEPLELDFIYGNLENSVFQPLDGQQRLTTLFLLHWYIAHKTNNLLEKENKDILQKFTYETRISSREFCNELISNSENFGTGDKISEQISDSSWFFLSWGKDPTIKAMLNTLDSIESGLRNIGEANLPQHWERLTSENSPITFHFKELNDIGLTDDLYIKMNARGKELTEFENFKAQFEKHIENKKWEENINTIETFSHKIDTIWTDLFWKYRDSDNQIDNEIIKFISGIAINYYAKQLEIYNNKEEIESTKKELEDKKSKNITDESIKRERIEKRIKLLIDESSKIIPEDFATKESFEYLKNCFDVYSKNNNNQLLPKDLPLWDFCQNKEVQINESDKIKNNLFIEFIKNDLTTYKQRALFYAQTEYLLRQDTEVIDEKYFSDWLRFIRNIVENSTIDSASSFIGVIGLIKEISEGCIDIYKYLTQNDIQSKFAGEQIKEEKLKAELIVENNLWKEFIFKAENDNFLKGEINFLLEFSKDNEQYNFDKFKIISENFLELFQNRDDLLRRALMTKEDYKIQDGFTYSLNANRYSLLDSLVEWKIEFRRKNEKLLTAVKKLLDTNKKIPNRNEYLDNLIKSAESINDYRKLLIKDISLLNKASHKRICLSSDNKFLYVLNKTKVIGENYKGIEIN